MLMRRRRPLARAAMIGGTAYVAGRAGQRAATRQQDEADREQYQEQRLADLEAQQAQAAPAPAAPSNDMVTRLGELSKLHSSGALTDAEFAAAKQQLLGS
jgi:putative oligomerization/nucleic acid binding protein